MKTAEQILKARGLTDADIANLSVLLSNAAYRAAIEGPVNELEKERDELRARDGEWAKLKDETYEPALAAAQKEAQESRLKLAEANEKLRIAKDYGYIDDKAQKEADEADERLRTQNQQGAGGFNPEDPKFRDFAGRFATQEGDAMATYNFVAEEYRVLNGDSINNYSATIDGRVVRGMPALRAEARKANKAIDLYAEEKFNWAGKRQEAEAKRQAERDARIAREAVEKYALEHPMAGSGNPLTGPPVVSRNPFVPSKEGGGSQPWEKNPVELRNQRIERAFRTETKATLQ